MIEYNGFISLNKQEQLKYIIDSNDVSKIELYEEQNRTNFEKDKFMYIYVDYKYFPNYRKMSIYDSLNFDEKKWFCEVTGFIPLLKI